MHIMSTNFTETMVWKHDYEVKLWRHKQHTPNTNDHHMPLNEPPHENFLRTPLHKRGILSRFSDKRPSTSHLLGAPKTKMA